MKKSKICKAAAIALLAATGLCMVSCQNSENEAMIGNTIAEESETTEKIITVEEKYHSRDELCGVSFSMWSAETDGIKYGFQQTCFTKEEAEKYIPELEQCIATVREKMKGVDSFSQDMELQVFVLDDVPAVSLSQAEGAVILAKDELENGQYRFPLFLSIAYLREDSQSFGAYAYIFDMEYDNERIKEYLSKEENRQVLDLFYPRMSEIYSNSAEIEIFQQILASLASELIEESGMNGYLEEPFTVNMVNNWLYKIGFENRCDDDNVDYLSRLQFMKDNECDFHIECGKVTYQFRTCKSLFESAGEMGAFIVSEMKARDAIGRYLKDNHVASPVFDEEFQLTYEIMGEKVQAIANTETDGKSASIYIDERYKHAFQETVTHELTHAYAGIEYGGDKAWMNEGFADYIAMVIFPQPSRREQLYAGIKEAESDAEYLWRTNYLAMEGVPEDIEDFNMSSYIDGYVIAYWDGDKTVESMMLEKTLWELGVAKKSWQGSELSYWEAESFVEYLIEQSSFETTWNCMVNNTDFEEVYGKTYDALKAEWIQSLREKVSGDS